MEASTSDSQTNLSIGKYVPTSNKRVIGNMARGMGKQKRFEPSGSCRVELPISAQCFTQSRRRYRQYLAQALYNMRSFAEHRQLSVSGLGYAITILVMCLLVGSANAVFINFENCLSQSYQSSNPPALQFTPLYMDASFNATNSGNLMVTVWGNVSGAYTQVHLPPPTDPSWRDPKSTDGKIENLTYPYTKLTTLSKKINVLTYEPWKETSNFCGELVNGTCPLGPSFNANASVLPSHGDAHGDMTAYQLLLYNTLTVSFRSNPYDFPSFSLSHNFYSSYAFTSLTATFLIIDGDTQATDLGCISAEITPDLGSGLSGLLTFIPFVVLVSVGFATAFASVYSPWGSLDIFRWTSNYGRDADLLRLVTPGFGDCLQYIQFIVLTGGLTLSYPGFYQPVVSKVSWSVLMFNESFVSKGKGSQSLVDGIYFTNGTYGLDNLSQLVGMSQVDDIWAGMIIWLLVILVALMALIQTGFLLRWIYRHLSDIQEEDLRAKNMPFSVGNVIRIVFSYFLLPIVALSMFQLVIASSSPIYTTVLAVILILALVGFAGWLLYIIASTRPRSFLFDDLPTVLLYGPLYNTYSDDAAAFALVPVLLTFIRGIAIGAVQPSGIAQIVLLAICEVITILTLHSFRPFHSPTSMNAYHTLFAVARLASILLMVAFAPSLGVTEGPKGWIGYAILLMHGIVLVFGFLLNAMQTIVEVVARLAGAGGDESGAARGGLVKVFGMRQLSRRLPRGGAVSRQSQLSSTAILEHDRKLSNMNEGRERSQSAGSAAVLLTRPRSLGHDSNGIDMMGGGAYTPTTPGEASAFSFAPSAAGQTNVNRNPGGVLGLPTGETADPYYRPPRFRRPTLEAAYSPGARSRGSWTSGDWANKRWSNQDQTPGTPSEDITEPLGPSISGRVTPVPNFPSGQPQRADTSIYESRRSKTDYTTREVDFYYGVRGPALNANVPNRRLKTGPVDPTGPASSAAGWFSRLLGGKTKEKGKGFEVVRSSRMPPGMQRMGAAAGPTPEGVPEGIPVATLGEMRSGPIESDDEEPVRKKKAKMEPLIPVRDDGELGSDGEVDTENFEMTRISDIPPSLPGIDIGEGIELPSRFPSKVGSSRDENQKYIFPSVPPKNPRRVSQGTGILQADIRNRAAVDLYDPEPNSVRHKPQDSTDSARLPFDRSNSKRLSTMSARSSINPLEEQVQANQSSTLDDSPTSLGHVHHHSIWTITDHAPGIDLLGSSAEIVNEGPSGSTRHSYDNTHR